MRANRGQRWTLRVSLLRRSGTDPVVQGKFFGHHCFRVLALKVRLDGQRIIDERQWKCDADPIDKPVGMFHAMQDHLTAAHLKAFEPITGSGDIRRPVLTKKIVIARHKSQAAIADEYLCQAHAHSALAASCKASSAELVGGSTMGDFQRRSIMIAQTHRHG